MLKPSLTDFTDFIEKPKLVKVKTKFQIQQDINLYLNIALFLIIIIGVLVLYYRGKHKEERKQLASNKITQLDSYMQDYMEEQIINSVLNQQNNNIPY